MPKTLKSLIRISNWRIDQVHRKLRFLLHEIDDLQSSLDKLESQKKLEQQITLEKPTEGGRTFGAYIEETKYKKARIFDEIYQKNLKIDEVRDEIRLIYIEAKKYEIAEENRDNKKRRDVELLDQANLDEVGILGYIKKQ